MLDTFELGANVLPQCRSARREFDRREDSTVGDTPRQEQLDLSAGSGPTEPAPTRAQRTRAGRSVPRRLGARRARRLPRAQRLPDRRHHLPPAGLLGAHLAGRAVHPQRGRLGQPAAVLVQGHPGPQDRQAAAGHRDLAAQHPRRRRPPAPARRAGPGQHHAVLRRHHGLRVHLAPRRSSTCCRAARACSASRCPAPCGR